MTAVDRNRKTTAEERHRYAARPDVPFDVYDHARALESAAWHQWKAEPTAENRHCHDRARAYLLDVVAGRC